MTRQNIEDRAGTYSDPLDNPSSSRILGRAFDASVVSVKMGSTSDSNFSSALTPVHFFSHGSTMMLGEESNSATYWKKCGDDALANGVRHVVMMVL